MESKVFPVVIISGPTASGKTMMSLKLGKKIQSELGKKAEIVNFDSLLFYKQLNIGTAKPTTEEQQEIHHHLVDISDIDSPLNASDYILMAKDKIDELHLRGIIPILVGGSAFYLRALVKGMYTDKSENENEAQQKVKIAQEALDIIHSQGIAPIRQYLCENDQESYHHLHENDHYRNARAYEFHRLTGKKISEQKKKADDARPYDFSDHPHQTWSLLHYYLNIPKEEHWSIIEKRTDAMLQNGLVNEIQAIKEQGYSGNEKPLKSIGYKEVLEHLNGETSLDQCREKIIIATRQLAKSQRTFFNKITPKETFHPIEQEQMFFNKVLEDLAKGTI